MEDLDRESERRDVPLIGGGIVLALILYAIGCQTSDSPVLLLLSIAALALGVPLMCGSFPPSESGKHFTVPRVILAVFVSLVGIVVTAVIGYFFPEYRYLSPALIGLAIVLPAYIRAPT